MGRHLEAGADVHVVAPLFLADLTGTLVGIGAFVVGIALGWVLVSMLTGHTLRRARRDAEQIASTARAEADVAKQRIELEAEKKARERRQELDREVTETTAEIKRDQARLSKREDALDKKTEKLTERESKLDGREGRIHFAT